MNRHVYLDLLAAATTRFGEHPCLCIKRNGSYETWTYTQFRRDVNRLASALCQHGMGPQQCCVVIGENTPEWIIAYHAAIVCGGLCVPVDPNLPADEIREIIQLTAPRVILCSTEFASLMQSLPVPAGEPRPPIVYLDGPGSAPAQGFREFLTRGDSGFDGFTRPCKPDDPMVIIFTSGTTGKAKGVVLMQRNYTTVVNHAIGIMGLNEQDVILAILPLHHVFGFAACVAGPLCGGMSVVCVPLIKGPLIIEALNDLHVTMLPAVPKMLTVLYDGIWRKVKSRGAPTLSLFRLLFAISSIPGPLPCTGFRRRLFATVHKGFGGRLVTIISGGAALPRTYHRGFLKLGFRIVEGYGLTETFGPITLCPRPVPGSVGPVLPENEIRIVDPDAAGVGHVLLRGLNIFRGYYGNDDATRDAIDPQGWFHTGDLGRLDRAGYLYLCGRSKDLIVLESGKNVYPDELEAYYETSPLIEEIGVVGYTNNRAEIAVALIVPAEEIRKKYSLDQSRDLIQNEVIRLGRNRPSYKKITDFVVVYQPLPRTTTRKLKKPLLRTMYQQLRRGTSTGLIVRRQLSAHDETITQSLEFAYIVESIRAVEPTIAKRAIIPTAHLEIDLGLDSLQKIDMLSMVEKRLEIALPRQSLVRIETVGDIYGTITELREKRSGDEPEPECIRKRLGEALAGQIPLQASTSPVYHWGAAITERICRSLWHLQVEGALPPDSLQGPVIFAANHESMLDPVLVLGALDWQIRRETYTLGKREITRIPLLTQLLRQCNFIDIDRSGDPGQALGLGLGILHAGKKLLIFPEGTRGPGTTPGHFKAGVGMLLLETNATLIPVRIRGAGMAWPAHKPPQLRLPPGSRVSVRFAPPLTLQTLIENGAITPYDSAARIAAAVRSIIAAM